MPGSRGLSTSQEMEADTGRPQRLYSSRHSVSTLLLLAACGLAVCARFDGGCSWVLGRRVCEPPGKWEIERDGLGESSSPAVRWREGLRGCPPAATR